MAHLAHYKRCAVGNMTGHYERVFEERGFSRANIDPVRTPSNYEIGGGDVRGRIAEAIEGHREASGRKVRKDANVLSDWVVTLPQDCPAPLMERFFEEVFGFVQERYGAENVPCGYVHLDETTPHIHIPVVPVTDAGRLSAKDVFTRRDLSGFHGDLQKRVDRALGRHVSVELTREQKAERVAPVDRQDGYRARARELEEKRREIADADERLERLRQREVGEAAAVAGLNRAIEEKELEPAGESVRESAGALFAARSDGSRERELEEENRRLRSRAAGLERDCGIARSRISELRRGIFEFRGRIEEIGTTLKERMKRLAERGKRGNPFDLAKESSAARERERVRAPGRAHRRERDWGMER